MRDNVLYFPHFLGIGAPRAGTTWLYYNLSRHPEIWMPHRKELHYFDRSTYYPTSSDLACNSLLKRLYGREAHNKKYRKVLVRTLYRDIVYGSWDNVRWDLRYFLRKCNDQWYESLFYQGKDKIRGEITPGYALLEDKDVEHISQIMPKLKVIYLIRNPIERTWSHVRRLAARCNKSLDSMSSREMVEFVDKRGIILASDYLRTLAKWSKHFPQDQLFIGFYDDIVSNPVHLMQNLFDFLNVEPAESHVEKSAFDRKNVGPSVVIPSTMKVYLARQYLSQIETLSKAFGGYAKSWLLQTNEILRYAEQNV